MVCTAWPLHCPVIFSQRNLVERGGDIRNWELFDLEAEKMTLTNIDLLIAASNHSAQFKS